MKNKLSGYIGIIGLLVLLLAGCAEDGASPSTEEPAPSPEGQTQLFEGILLAEAGKEYWHLGLYAGEIQVTKALEASRRWVGSAYPPGIFRGCAD